MKVDVKEGKKDTEGKPDWSYLPMDFLEGVVRVFEQGGSAEEYDGKQTWLPGIKYSKLFAAIMHHLVDWFFRGLDKDMKSGEHPLCHVVANCLMLLSYKDNLDYDDRVKK